MREACFLSSVHAFKQNLGLDSYHHLVPVDILLTGRSSSSLLFQDTFQLITTGLLQTLQGIIGMMQRGSCSKILFCFSVCEVLWNLSGQKNIPLMLLFTGGNNLHLKKPTNKLTVHHTKFMRLLGRISMLHYVCRMVLMLLFKHIIYQLVDDGLL